MECSFFKLVIEVAYDSHSEEDKRPDNIDRLADGSHRAQSSLFF